MCRFMFFQKVCQSFIMITVNDVKQDLPHSLLVLLFEQDTELAVSLSAIVEEKTCQFPRYNFVWNKKKEKNLIVSNKILFQNVFQPRIVPTSEKSWKLYIQPLKSSALHSTKERYDFQSVCICTKNCVKKHL